jgi:hypothetical protein
VDTTIRNLDPRAYRQLKARAAQEGRTIGEVVSEAIRAYVARPLEGEGRLSLGDWAPEPYPEGDERLSEQVDRIVYGLGS